MAKKTSFNTVYSSITDNLTLLKFPVWVRESYSPITLFRTDPVTGSKEVIPPARTVNELNENDVCKAMYSVKTIVDVIVNGHWIEFENSGDIEVIHDWLKLYVDQVNKSGLDMKTDVFFQNAKLVIAKLEENITGRKVWTDVKHPPKPSIEALLAAL